MEVSVVIPVYNAHSYVADAVSSALMQPETAEVLLVEDGSTDESLATCEVLARESECVRLLRHPDGGNHGPSASRNLGIREARYPYVAFLDSDDYFLPGRFSVAKTLFAEDPELDGVYEAMGLQFEDEASEHRWRAVRGDVGLTTMTQCVAPDELFEMQSPLGPCGYCTTGGWVVKRDIFSRTGLFDAHLIDHEDTAMFVKFAAKGKMAPGRLREPVVIRRVHAGNRSSSYKPPRKAYADRIRMWATLWHWAKENLPKSREQFLLQRFLDFATIPYRGTKGSFGRRLLSRLQVTGLAFVYPSLIFERRFWVHYGNAVLPIGKGLKAIRTRLLVPP